MPGGGHAQGPTRTIRALGVIGMLPRCEVVNLTETFEDKNFFYMVMELCEGGELVPLAAMK